MKSPSNAHPVYRLENFLPNTNGRRYVNNQITIVIYLYDLVSCLSFFFPSFCCCNMSISPVHSRSLGSFPQTDISSAKLCLYKAALCSHCLFHFTTSGRKITKNILLLRRFKSKRFNYDILFKMKRKVYFQKNSHAF